MASAFKNITVFYSHSASNIGDVAINRGAQVLIEQAFPDCRMNFVSLPTQNPKFHDAMRASFLPSPALHHTAFAKDQQAMFDYIADPDLFLETCGASDADLVLVNSGEHLFSYDNAANADSLFWRTLPIYAAKRAGKAAAVLPSTYGPFLTRQSQSLVEAVLKLADGAAAREPLSLDMQKSLVPATDNPVLPDPAFFISPAASAGPARPEVRRLGVAMRLETWGIRLDAANRFSQKALARGNKESISGAFSAALCSAFLSQPDREIVLFIQTDADADLAEAIRASLTPAQQDAVTLARPETIDDYCAQLGEIDHLVTSRFHAIILATLMKRPSSGIYFDTHGHKIPGLSRLFPALGAPCNLSSVAIDEAVASVMDRIGAGDGFSTEIDQAMEHGRGAAVRWLGSLGNKACEPAMLLQASAALGYYGNQLRETAVRVETEKAFKSAGDQRLKEQDALLAKLSKDAAKLGKVTEALAAENGQMTKNLQDALKAGTRLQGLEVERAQLVSDRERLEADLARLSGELAQARAQLVAVQKETTALLAEKSALEARLASVVPLLEAERDRVAATADTLKTDLARINEQLHEKGKALAVSEKLVELREQEARQQATALENARAQFESLERSKAALEEQKSALETQLSDAAARFADLESDMAGKNQRVRELETNIDKLTALSRGVIKQAAGAVQTSLQYKVGQEVLRTLKRPYRAAILPLNLWRMRKSHIQKIKSGKAAPSIAELDQRMTLEGARLRSAFLSGSEIGRITDRRLLRHLFWAARKAKDKKQCSQILARLEKLQSQKFIEAEERYLDNFRSILGVSTGETLPLPRDQKEDHSKPQIPQQQNSVNEDRTSVASAINWSEKLHEYEIGPAVKPRSGHVCFVSMGSLAYHGDAKIRHSHELAKGLSKRGYKPQILTRPGYPNDAGVDPKLISANKKQSYDDVDYFYLGSLKNKNDSLFDYLEHASNAIEEMIRKNRPEFIISDASIHVALPAFLVARRTGLPYICDLMCRVDFSDASGSALPKPLITEDDQLRFELELCKQADAIVLQDQELKEKLLRHIADTDSVVLIGLDSVALPQSVVTEETSDSAEPLPDHDVATNVLEKAIEQVRFKRIDLDLQHIEGLIPDKASLAYTPEPDQVLYILHNSMPYASGGYATRGHGLAKGLIQNGFSVTSFTRPGFPVDIAKRFLEMQIDPVNEIDGVSYRNDGSLRRGSVSDIDYILLAADVYEAEIRRLRPAYVQAASFATWTGIPALIAARRTGTPFAYEVRGLAEVTNMSRIDNYSASPEYRWLAALEAIACKHADHVFTLTGAMKEELVSRDVDPATITLLPNSCDVDNFHPAKRDKQLAAELGISAREIVIGYIGTFVDYEGLDDLTAACAELKRRGVKFKLLLVGSENVQKTEVGPIASLIHRIAEEGNLKENMIMPGRVPHDLVHGYYSLIDVAAFPRKPLPVTELVSPMKPLEAMAMEKAVLVSSVGALAEMVEDGETGLVFEKGSITDLADKLELLAGDTKLRKRLGGNAREWVRENRTWNATASILARQIRAMTQVNKA